MADIILLDGGMGQELIARSTEPPSPLWSAAVLEHDPALVEAVHRDFVTAGARVVTLNSYAATPERLARYMPADEVDERFQRLQAAALAVAHRATERAPHEVAVAGCLPPLGGSYHPDAAPDPDTMLRTYRRIVAIQRDRCAVLLAETMSSVAEARMATRAMREADRPAWVAFSVDDADGTRLRSGERLEEGRDGALAEGADALLLNCSRPEAIEEGLGIVAESGVPFGAYANGFTNAAELEVGGTVAGMGVRADLGPDAYAGHAMRWIARGATIVGGCCEVAPAHIARLRVAIEAAGHRLVVPPPVHAEATRIV